MRVRINNLWEERSEIDSETSPKVAYIDKVLPLVRSAQFP